MQMLASVSEVKLTNEALEAHTMYHHIPVSKLTGPMTSVPLS